MVEGAGEEERSRVRGNMVLERGYGVGLARDAMREGGYDRAVRT